MEIMDKKGGGQDKKMEEADESQKKNRIETFVFFDIEATGLVSADTRILELSLVAVSREDLLSMNKMPHQDTKENGTSKGLKRKALTPTLPRVLHKYTRLYYPKKMISPKLEEITGLNNDLLHRLPGFSKASAEAIALFMDLPSPVCLVAHNGSRYDLPLLKAELIHVSAFEKFCNVQCVDTLTALKDIDALQSRDMELNEISEITELAESFSMDMYDDFMEAGPSSKRSRSEEYEEEKICVENAPANTCTVPHNGGNQPVLEVSAEPTITPVKNHIPAMNYKTPATPNKAKASPAQPVTPEQSGGYVSGSPVPNLQNLAITKNVRRSLTYGGSSKKKWDGTMPYKLSNIYKRLFGTDFNAHRAENDCLALLQISGYYGERFVEWADTFHSRFTEVKPMWTKKISFRL